MTHLRPVDPGLRTAPSTLSRLKLAEPVRLYLYSVGAVLVAGLVLAGAVTGEWSEFALAALAALLAVPAGTEAARASVYSPRTMLLELTRAQAAWKDAA